MRRRYFKIVSMVLITVLIAGFLSCDLTESADPDEHDLDGDGLSNEYEITIGTNPNRADTDGDGWDDNEELDFGGAFSPLLANLPELSLQILNVPVITLHETVGESYTNETSIVESISTETDVTTSQTRTEATALENAWNIEATLGYNLGVESKVTYAATAGYSGSYTTESGYSWGKEQTISNSQSIENAKTYAATNDVSFDGATLSVDVTLKNTSTIAYNLENLIVSGYQMNTDSARYGSYKPIGLGDMKIEGLGDGGKITLAAGASSGSLTLTQEIPNPSDAMALAQECPNLVFSISGYSISTSGGGITSNDFTHEMTEVAALCAKVMINPGVHDDSLAAEQYLVAARTKYNPDAVGIDDRYETLSLIDIFSNMGMEKDVDYVTGTDGHLTELDGVAEGDVATGQWLIIVENLAGDRSFYTAEDAYDLEEIDIEPGYIVNIIYSVDEDGDGLVLAIEKMYGSDDTLVDSDGDTIDDVDEVLGWDLGGDTIYTNPALADTDGDGLNDNVDPDPLSLSKNISADISSLCVLDRLENEFEFTEEDQTFTSDTAVLGAYVNIELNVLEAVSAVRIKEEGAFDLPMDKDSSDDTLYTFEIVPIDVGDTTYTITVTSEDGSVDKEYTLELTSELEDISKLTFTDEGLNSSGARYQMDLGFNWGSYYDSRADGALLLYSWGQDPPTDYQLPTTDLLPKTLKQDSTATEYASSDEEAVYLWTRTAGSAELEDSCGEFFLGSFYDRQYSFRVVPYALQDGQYFYAPGRASSSATFTTPKPTRIMIDTIDITYRWDETEGSESSPEFRIDVDLDDEVDDEPDESIEEMGTNRIMNLTTWISTKWKPTDGVAWRDDNTVNHTFTLEGWHDVLFVIDHYIEEDETAGEHLISRSDRKIQWEEEAGDEIYGLNTEGSGRYAHDLEICRFTYSDEDKGDFTMIWETSYHTVSHL